MRIALHQIHTALEELSPAPDIPAVRASFSASFVALWLLPRNPGFAALYPNIMLRLEESDSGGLDLAAGKRDFSARLGDGAWPGLRSTFLVAERIGAVAAPAYLARLVRGPRRPAPPHSRAGLTVPDYDAAVGAALMGQGVALGWEHLAAGKITQGALQWIGTDRIETGQSIYLVEQAGRAEAAHLARFRSWITAPFAA